MDAKILSMLTGPIRVNGIEYLVAWNSHDNVANIVYFKDGEMKYLRDAEDNAFEFSRELEAHHYLVGWKTSEEGEDESWKTMD